MGWPVPEGVLEPCGANPDGSVLEFFVHPETARDLLAGGPHVFAEPGRKVLRRFELTATPSYWLGVQVRAVEVAA